MRTEIRKVTVETEVYISDDGVEFDDEDVCRYHEINVKHERLKMYHSDLSPCDDIDAAYYVNLVTQADVDDFNKVCEHMDYNLDVLPDEPGVYGWLGDNWVNLEKILTDIRGGEWEIVIGSDGKEKMVCTNCRHQQDLAATFTYCPNCGVRMHNDNGKFKELDKEKKND